MSTVNRVAGSSAPLTPASRLAFTRRFSLGKTSGGETAILFWLSGSLLYSLSCASLALRQAFASQFSFADDAREHVFWMFRFLDRGLFPHDAIADYFQALAPPGYASAYSLLARAGIDPLLASKLLPAALSLVATAYFFGFALRFFRSGAGAAFTTILFIQCLWSNSDLASATPRAFFYPVLVAFLFYHERGSFAGVIVAVALGTLFFPPVALLCLGVLGFACFRWKKGPHLISLQAREWRVVAAAAVVAAICIAPYLRQTNTLGPVVSYAEARHMPEFGPEGRVPVFFSSWWGNWVAGNAGVHTLPTRPPWFLFAFLWPVVRRFPGRFSSLQRIPRGASPVPLMIAASLTFFLLAHLLLFHLYLPNRYTAEITRVLLILLGGGVIFALRDGLLFWTAAKARFGQVSGRVLSAALVTAILAWPLLVPEFPMAGYLRGDDPALYRFFAAQPATSRIASLSDEADDLPILTRRSVVINAECAVPFHPRYYLPLRERGLEIARAQYSADLGTVQRCVRHQQIDFWLLDAKAFRPRYWQKSRLLRQLRLDYSREDLGVARNGEPVLEHPPAVSIVYRDSRFLVIDVHRLLRSAGPAT